MKEHLLIVVWLLSGVLINRADSTGTLDQLSVRTATPGAAGRTRSEIDLETDKSVIICAGQNKSLECFSPGSSIAIEEAFWGRLSAEICPSEDGDPVTNCLSDPTTTPIVRNLCDDKEYCEIPARHNVLQPPGVKHCPGVNKYLAVKYKCVPEKHKFVLCNGETTELQCSQGWNIHVMSAYWGRDSPSTCPTPLGKFFTCANSADSVLALRERCSGRESCIVTADDKHLTKEGSHCPGIDKYAVISYRCQPPGDVTGDRQSVWHSERASIEDTFHRRLDPSSDSGKKLLESPQQDILNTLHSVQALAANPMTVSPQQPVGQLNLSMLLPVPQYNRADNLKPIIDFLGEESGGKNVTKNTGENLPVPKDSRPKITDKKANSNVPVQNGITPTSLGKQNGIASSTKLHLTNDVSSSTSGVNTALGLSKNQAAEMPQSTQANEASTLGSVNPNNGKMQTNPTQKPQVSTAVQPAQSITEELVKSFLKSKFGQALGKSLLDTTMEDSSFKNIMERHFSSNPKPTSSPTKNVPENPVLVANLVSGLIHQHAVQDSTTDTALNGNNQDTATPVKQDSAGLNNVSSPTVSIGNKVFSLTDLANSLLGEKHVPTESKSVNEAVETKQASRRHPAKHGNKEKIRILNQKISTLETLSDALDALTKQLSPEEESEGKKEQKKTPLSSDKPTIPVPRHRKHHTHHHKSDQFSEDIDMLGALLGRGTTHNTAAPKKNPVIPKDDIDLNLLVGMKGKKTLTSSDLEVLQNKINQAIEMAEAVGRQNGPAKQSMSKWLSLLVSGKADEDVGAQTREEVATVRASPVASKGILPSKDHQLHLQDILTRLINNAMRKGTLNQLVQKWDRSGSPFAQIAKNISLYLQGNSKPKAVISKLESQPTLNPQPKTKTGIDAAAQTNMTSQLAKAFAGLTAGYNNFTSSDAKNLFTKAVDNILGAIAKRKGLNKSNATNRSSFVTTDTLTNFKGILLGGRINKLKHIPDSVVGLESKILAEILEGHGNKTFLSNYSVFANVTVGNKAGAKSDNKTADVLPGNHTLQNPLLGGQGKQKLTYSSYETKNVSRTLQNNTLMDFMKSMEEPADSDHGVPGQGGPQLPMMNDSRTNPGDKHSRVKPHVNNLMSMIAASLLALDDNKEGSPSKNRPKLTYQETGKETMLHGFPNDHKISDFSKDNAVLPVLQAPSDYPTKTNITNNRPNEQQKNSTQSSAVILSQNNTKSFFPSEKPVRPEDESHKVDLGDQTVTLTLETVDDAPTPAPQTNEGPKAQTGLRNNKVPHNLNLQSAITLGKINATNAKSMEHPFPQGQIQELPKALSGFATETKKPQTGLPSDGNGELTTIFPSPEANSGIGAGTSQAKSKPELPLGLQMNAIGRIAETDNKASVTPADLSAALTSSSTSDLTSALASKTGDTKSFEDKILPMASDLTSVPEAEGGETESIVSKAPHATLQNPGIIPKPSFTGAATRSEARPSASEVREIATSIKALLKILNTYSKKLRLEDDEDGSSREVLPTRSSTASRVSANKEDMVKSPSSGVTATKYNDNVYANLPPSSITLPNYVDSGVFENIHEQPNAETNNYNWNFGPAHAHPQMPFDINPTKTSLEPRLGADQWRPANEASVTGELKSLNLPSIEDDPTVRAVQNIVAEENAFLSQKRKAIQKHEQSDSSLKSQLPKRPGVLGRNTIPKQKGHHRNETHVIKEKNKKKDANVGKGNDTRKSNVRGRNEIPRQRKSNDTRKSIVKGNHGIPQQKTRNDTKESNVRGRDEIPRQSKRNDTMKLNAEGSHEIPRQSNLNDKRKSNVKSRDEIPRQSTNNDTRKSMAGIHEIPRQNKGNNTRKSNVRVKAQRIRNDRKKSNVRGRDEIPRQNGDKRSQLNAPAAGQRKPVTPANITHHENKTSSSPPGTMGNSGNTTHSVSSRDKIPGNRKHQNSSTGSTPASRDTKRNFKTKHDPKKGPLSVHRPNSTSTKAHDQRNRELKPVGEKKLSHRLNNTQVTGDKRNLQPMKLGKKNDMSKGNVTNVNDGTKTGLKHVRARKIS